MIEAINTASVRSTSLRSQPQAVRTLTVASEPAQAPGGAGLLRIRVDTLLNKAILEQRSAETGDVVRQYPTEAQIRAFQRAAELEQRSEAQATRDSQRATAAAAAPSQAAAAPAVVELAPVPAPASTAAPVQTAAAGGDSGATTTQSILV